VTNFGGDHSSTSQAPSPAPSRREFSRRRAVALFLAAGIGVVLALTTKWLLPGISTLFGLLEANSEEIGAFADLAEIVTFVMLLVGAILGYLGFKRLQVASMGEGAHQAVDVALGGRGVAVGGDVNRGAAVVLGDHSQVEVFGDVTYNYGDVRGCCAFSSGCEHAQAGAPTTRSAPAWGGA
jgi:hypothetical protein